MRGTVETIAFLAGLTALVVFGTTRCTPAEEQTAVRNAENAAAVAQYDAALVGCQKTARTYPEAQRFDAYVRCERAVTAHFCEASVMLAAEWARCKEAE